MRPARQERAPQAIGMAARRGEPATVEDCPFRSGGRGACLSDEPATQPQASGSRLDLPAAKEQNKLSQTPKGG